MIFGERRLALGHLDRRLCASEDCPVNARTHDAERPEIGAESVASLSNDLRTTCVSHRNRVDTHAIQNGVPTKVLRRDLLCESCAATPKSAVCVKFASVRKFTHPA